MAPTNGMGAYPRDKVFCYQSSMSRKQPKKACGMPAMRSLPTLGRTTRVYRSTFDK